MTAHRQQLTPSEVEGRRWLTEIFQASTVPFETAARMRKHFRMGPRFWTLITPSS